MRRRSGAPARSIPPRSGLKAGLLTRTAFVCLPALLLVAAVTTGASRRLENLGLDRPARATRRARGKPRRRNGASPPTIGDDLVVAPGTPEMQVRNIDEVCGNGPSTVGLVSSFAKDHAADARVALAYASDGAHSSSALRKSGAAIIESCKANGTLP